MRPTRVMIILLIGAAILVAAACTEKSSVQPEPERGMLGEVLPEGYTFLGSHDVTGDMVDLGLNGSATEGVYRFNGSDVYLIVATAEDAGSAEAFYDGYVAQYPEWHGQESRFSKVSVNGHDVLVIARQVMRSGDYDYEYDLIWQNGEQVVVIKAPTVDIALRLAEATGL